MTNSDDDGDAQPRPKRLRGRPKGGELLADHDQVLAAAIRAVRALGPSVTMDAIAAEAGVTKPIVYRAIGDKQAVADAVAEYLSLRVEKLTSEMVKSSDDPRTQYSAAARAFFELATAERTLFQFVIYGWGSNDGRQLVHMIERSAEGFMDNFEVSGLSKRFPTAAGQTWSYASVGALRSVALMWIREPYCDIDELVEYMTDFAFRPYRRDGPRLNDPAAPQ